MASSLCHVFDVAKQFRLERIVRHKPDRSGHLTEVTQTLQQQVAVNLYQLKSRINYSYMMVLLFQDQRELLVAKQNTINSKIKEVTSGVKNGAILPASEQVLEAELLKLEQALTENSFQRIKELQNLSSLTTTSFEATTILEKPITNLKNEGIRPEIQFWVHGI